MRGMVNGLLIGLLLGLTAASSLENGSPEALLQHVKTLSAAEMEGRAVGTKGIERAAAYIAEQFELAGLEPGGDHGTYFQGFEVTTGVTIGPRNSLALEFTASVPERETYQVGKDFSPFGFSEEGQIRGEVVFAGYGITAPELRYDDYDGLDVKDRIVLVLTHEPRERDPRGPFRDPSAFRYTEVRHKVLNAREHGARGIIVVSDPLNHADEPEELFAVRGVSAGARSGIVAVNAMRRVAEAILAPSGKGLAQLQRQIDEEMTPHSFLIKGATLTLEVSLIREKGRTANVVGILPGTDPSLRRSAVVIGAHYDHLGRGGETSLVPSQYGEIHHGADDNASGVAGVIELARTFAATGGARRTLVFAAFTGEELGLLGSSHYVKHAPLPIEETVAMINLDSIGRMRDGNLYIHGVATGREFKGIIERASQGLGLKLNLGGDGYGPSDHTPFSTKERPVLFLFTGPHQDYHRPSDTAEKINANGLARVVTLAYRVAAKVANRLEPITFVRVKESQPPPSSEGRSGYGPYFGSIPDFAESGGEGVHISGVRPGSPAERAGLQAGDVIVKFGGVAVRNLYDLTYALRSKRPGEAVEVIFLRNGQELKAMATLEKRK